MHSTQRAITDVRVSLSRFVRRVNNDKEIIYLTSSGLRVAAIVPVAVADAALAAEQQDAPRATAA